MDEQFQNVSHTIIDKFLEKVADSCHIKKEALWSLWRDMFSFPIEKAPKKTTKPKKSETKSETKVETKVENPKEKSEPKVDTEKSEKTPPKKKRDTCQFKLLRGERAGQECGKGVSKTSEQFCTNHCK